MINIADIDPNFRIESSEEENLIYVSCFEGDVEINGLYKPLETGKLLRMPEEFTRNEEISEEARSLMYNTAGARIRFSTNAPCISIAVEVSLLINTPHMPMIGASGIDVYIAPKGSNDYKYRQSGCMPKLSEDSDRFFKRTVVFSDFDSHKEHEVMIHLPLYNGVNNLIIGYPEGSYLDKPVKYVHEKPICFYGSSVTHGGCASRAGNNYPNHLSRWLKSDFVNIGFSGNARGEKPIAKYIAEGGFSLLLAELDMCENNKAKFIATHKPFYEEIRKYNKELPIVFMSFPGYPKIHHEEGSNRRDYLASNEIILETCRYGWENGDKNLYYIDGLTLYGNEDQDACTVDFCHPNDHGFYMMAKVIYPVLNKILNGGK